MIDTRLFAQCAKLQAGARAIYSCRCGIDSSGRGSGPTAWRPVPPPHLSVTQPASEMRAANRSRHSRPIRREMCCRPTSVTRQVPAGGGRRCDRHCTAGLALVPAVPLLLSRPHGQRLPSHLPTIRLLLRLEPETKLTNPPEKWRESKLRQRREDRRRTQRRPLSFTPADQRGGGQGEHAGRRRGGLQGRWMAGRGAERSQVAPLPGKPLWQTSTSSKQTSSSLPSTHL